MYTLLQIQNKSTTILLPGNKQSTMDIVTLKRGYSAAKHISVRIHHRLPFDLLGLADVLSIEQRGELLAVLEPSVSSIPIEIRLNIDIYSLLKCMALFLLYCTCFRIFVSRSRVKMLDESQREHRESHQESGRLWFV